MEMDSRRLCGSYRARSFVSMRLSAVRKLSSRMSERNGDRLVLVLVATCGYDSEMRSELQLASLAYLRLLNSSTTYQHWPDWPYSNILVVSLTHQGTSATTMTALLLLCQLHTAIVGHEYSRDWARQHTRVHWGPVQILPLSSTPRTLPSNTASGPLDWCAMWTMSHLTFQQSPVFEPI